MSAPHDQHFLTDPDAIRKIARFSDIKDQTVLEIGPGKGALTKELLERGAKVIAIEIDPKMIEILGSRFADEIDSGRLNLLNEDAVRLPRFRYRYCKSSILRISRKIPRLS